MSIVYTRQTCDIITLMLTITIGLHLLTYKQNPFINIALIIPTYTLLTEVIVLSNLHKHYYTSLYIFHIL